MGQLEHFLKSGKLKSVTFSKDMCMKELNISQKDYEAAMDSFRAEGYKWATIQGYYALFHAVRALLFHAGYREESHTALKIAFRELYIDTNLMKESVYKTLERGMNLREMADYKDSYSKTSAEQLLCNVKESIEEIKSYFDSEGADK
ncbi:MAG: hypothetical protein CVU86_09060 [Firmicutes bacterium HGW-Firmicutes-11]|jgi:uncharacterized protein (UPF0332 family)|nr:MAG: hypothetical protein CVU86_09060 [Firmicutes bacterium HGW-Firmicutes-11]